MRCYTDKTAGGYVISALVNILNEVQIVQDDPAAQSWYSLVTHCSQLLVVNANSSKMSMRVLKQSTRIMRHDLKMRKIAVTCLMLVVAHVHSWDASINHFLNMRERGSKKKDILLKT